MKIGFLVSRPTQFEAPFYRFVARDPDHLLEALFTASDPGGSVYDREVGQEVDWGIELLEGYPYVVFPRWGRARTLAEHLSARRYDLLITNGYTQAGYLRAARLARRAGTPTALRLDSLLRPRPGAREAAKRMLFRSVLTRIYDLFLATGTLTRRYLAAMGVPDSRIGLFPYAIDAEHFRSQSRLDVPTGEAMRRRLGVPPGARIVLTVSKLNRREAPWDLIQAFAALRGVPVWLIVVGDGPLRGTLERQAAQLGVTRVAFAGYVPHGELPALYGIADVFVHVPREEHWGVSVAEALAAGLPVVASKVVGAAHDLISDGRNGFACEAGDTDGVSRRITDALGLDRQVVSTASARILERWNYASTWRGLLDAAGRAPGLRVV